MLNFPNVQINFINRLANFAFLYDSSRRPSSMPGLPVHQNAQSVYGGHFKTYAVHRTAQSVYGSCCIEQNGQEKGLIFGRLIFIMSFGQEKHPFSGRL